MESDDARRAIHKKADRSDSSQREAQSMTIEEWKSIDEIPRSTTCMHLAEDVYFSMATETKMFKLWEKLQAVYEK